MKHKSGHLEFAASTILVALCLQPCWLKAGEAATFTERQANAAAEAGRLLPQMTL